MDAFIVLSVIGVILCYLAYTGRGERARQHNLETTRHQVRDILDIIYEKHDIAKSSEDVAKRKKEIDEAVQAANDLANSYPDYANYKSLLDELEETKSSIYTDIITNTVSSLLKKSKYAALPDKKIDYASSAIVEIETGLRNAHANGAVLKKRKKSIEMYINKVKIEGLKQDAELYEFKMEYAKAVDSYLSILFLLKHKSGGVAIKSININDINTKVEILRKNIPSPQS